MFNLGYKWCIVEYTIDLMQPEWISMRDSVGFVFGFDPYSVRYQVTKYQIFLCVTVMNWVCGGGLYQISLSGNKIVHAIQFGCADLV